MTKLATIGVSGLAQCRTTAPSNKMLFQPWPKNELEPYGNPAYEGTGYPAAGYGQSWRKVVGLAQPKVANPQLQQWDGKHPVLNRLTIGELNKNSDSYKRSEVAALSGLGCACSSVDKRMRSNLRGLAAAEASTMQSIADAIVRGVVPESFLQQVTDKLLADEKANAEAYAAVQQLKRLKLPFAAEEKAQQLAWAQTNTAKFYALLIPAMQARLGFTDGKPKVTKPDYAYIKRAADGGVFSKLAQVLQDAATSTAAKNLLNAGYMKDSSLNGLGIAWVPIGIGVALIVAAGLFAWLQSNDPATASAKATKALTDAYSAGKMSSAEFKAAMQAIRDNSAAAGKGTTANISDIVTYGAIGVGAIVVLNIISSLRQALPSR